MPLCTGCFPLPNGLLGVQQGIEEPGPQLQTGSGQGVLRSAGIFAGLSAFEELLNLYRGTSKNQEVYYYYAMTHYGMQDYILAAYHLKSFANTFPQNDRAEECAYLAAYCYYLDSPRYSLDQSSTNKAINELQLFINQHPGSSKVDTATLYIDRLRDKLERKSFEIGKQYLKIGNLQIGHLCAGQHAERLSRYRVSGRSLIFAA